MDEIKKDPVSKYEIAAAFLMYPIAYIYTLIFSDNGQVWFGIFVLLFVLLTEYVNRAAPHPRESWIWLGCITLITLSAVFGMGQVWDFDLSVLFVHALAVWWVLARSGRLLENESGHLLPADAVNGLIVIPFGSFFLRLRCLGSSAAGVKKGGGAAAAATVTALAAGAFLLYRATAILAAADPGFNDIVENILAFLTPKDSTALWEFALRFFISLPVAAWLFGLVAGSVRMSRSRLDADADRIRGTLAKLRVVPATVWAVCAGAFSLVYLLFFTVQGGYFFGAFSRSLPEGFTVAEYARQGFFELCRVMVINFLLVWLITRTGAGSEKSARMGKITGTLLLLCGMLFAVVAISKLALYISCFGYTPKRLQSTWLALVLLAGGICWAVSLWTGKKSFRVWLIFGAVTLTALHFF